MQIGLKIWSLWPLFTVAYTFTPFAIMSAVIMCYCYKIVCYVIDGNQCFLLLLLLLLQHCIDPKIVSVQKEHHCVP